MRPLQLRFEAFGSYPGVEVVDFEALTSRGLFVVSGDTGTGKTTIFDAMCWALFGRMPGKDAKEVRSHHVPDDVRTEVSFTFECDGERYQVIRNPEQLRPRARGAGTAREPAAAQLIRFTDDGTESLATQITAVDRHCAELIGLGAEQFQRVILLPQGEFSKFLLANTADRETLLGQLFGGHVYERILDHLKRVRDHRRDALGSTNRAIDEQLNVARANLRHTAAALNVTLADDIDVAERERLTTLVSGLEPSVSKLSTEVDHLRHAMTDAAGAHLAATDAAQRLVRATGLRAQLVELVATAPGIDAAVEAANRSALARPVVEAADRLRAARAAAQRSAQRRNERVEHITSGFSSIGLTVDLSSATQATALLGERRAEVARHREVLRAVTDARAQLADASSEVDRVVAELEAATTTLTTADSRRIELDGQIAETQAAAVDLTSLDAGITAAQVAVEQRRQLSTELVAQATAADVAARAATRHAELLDAFVRTEAPRLASTLVDGDPCPVCGSADHPSPATTDGHEPTTFDQVQEADEGRQKAQRNHDALATSVAALRVSLGDDANATVEDLVAAEQALVAQRTGAVTAHAALATLTAEREATLTSIAEQTQLLATLRERHANLEKAVLRRNSDQVAAMAAANGLDADAVEREFRVLADLSPLFDDLETCFASARSDADAERGATEHLEAALAVSPFETSDDAAAAHLGADVEERHRAAKQQHGAQLAAAQGALTQLESQGIPEERPDLDATSNAAATAATLHDQRAAALQTASDAIRYTTEALERHDALVNDSGEQRLAAEYAERTYKVCSTGGGGLSMSLERWVLTRELDRVTKAANVHLHRMTGERYTVRRVEERADQRRVFGLDLEVLDAQTGRARSTTSLSGGEQFQASLALALGLADVVSHGGASSGKRFEALFVDEGFGSLSADALDDAIETLHQLHATGRMVGAITHVDAMKEQLHVGIEVKRRAEGDGSTLVVHP